MNSTTLKKILDALASGDIDVCQAQNQLSHLAMEDIDYAHIDHHRSLRKGFPEVIFGESKSVEQITGIMERMISQEQVVLVTRVDAEKASQVLQRFPEADYNETARMIRLQKQELAKTGQGVILVISAGTSDIPAAMEASLTADAMGNEVQTLFDVGVAGIHRLFAHKEQIEQARVLIVAAGMEGALPSVVAGMVSRPVIAVPTSVGYGVSLGGITALLGMLNSCSSNVAVVNIDNGFGAGYIASSINRI
ncbi:MAG: nickel pincer cofactor biosynthesis protein LarB [Desulfobacteraceae bacterium]|nr:nickel pincer cofactor biosynthesis protein LarB [Desulfobacteraceae bacterium]